MSGSRKLAASVAKILQMLVVFFTFVEILKKI